MKYYAVLIMNDLQLHLTKWMNHKHNIEQNKQNTKEQYYMM